jgi:cardiolipin synthase
MSSAVEIRPTFISKVTTGLQLITILLALSFKCLPWAIDGIWPLSLYWVTAFFTIVSGLNYMARGMELINHDTKK